jgi:hypothetical protein
MSNGGFRKAPSPARKRRRIEYSNFTFLHSDSLQLCKGLGLHGQNSGTVESKSKRSCWAGNKRYATARLAVRSGTSIGHMQGQERCTCGNLLLTFKTV